MTNRVCDNRVCDNRLNDNRLNDNRLSNNRLSDTKLSDNRLSDNRHSDKRLSDNRLSDNRLSDSIVYVNRVLFYLERHKKVKCSIMPSFYWIISFMHNVSSIVSQDGTFPLTRGIYIQESNPAPLRSRDGE